MKKAIFGILLSLALAACGPVDEVPPEPKTEPKKTEAKKTFGPVVTIRCKLRHYRTGQITTGTYFIFDTRTKHIPTDKMLGSASKAFKINELEHFTKLEASSRLTDGWVEIPLMGDHKFKLDVERIWFYGYLTIQYFDPQGQLKSTTTGIGNMGFGEKIAGKNALGFAGNLSFTSSGNRGASGTWSYVPNLDTFDPKTYDWGYLECDWRGKANGDGIRDPKWEG